MRQFLPQKVTKILADEACREEGEDASLIASTLSTEISSVSAAFVLDPLLHADTHAIGRFSLSRVLMLDDARYPWLVLVPEIPGLEEIIDLTEHDQQQLMREIASASKVLQTLYKPDKLNVGALGNRVRQLHVHVLARFVSDVAWPGPVWGVGPAQPYPPHMAGVTMDRLVEGLRSEGLKDIMA
jgi:diadenosine tetraphosphate (Ap4A) HIT family hydrolase